MIMHFRNGEIPSYSFFSSFLLKDQGICHQLFAMGLPKSIGQWLRTTAPSLGKVERDDVLALEYCHTKNKGNTIHLPCMDGYCEDKNSNLNRKHSE